ncbi:HAMP domain-containing sensor histidine kinase [Nocardioides sp. S-58]|uniref:histidine kinase n=1 Tax=Nocardioides renjunii TaxID=3095075 RepID=A0ABU5K9I2_9ACTN|nr:MULTISPECIES: HAMP domain-containing sensor histidine kinase [unclassified Nocardioides]MDZ5661562.1 HAMP domain-containing sensor histidine kinase [Nocardioides sp. S-58]WQQ22560.1 HAMP domain-containing sensor histidine kinase [Nocardioides sp. S-34]
MSNDGGAYVRPRGQAWGNEAQRAVLHAIAEDVARRSRHRVAAIEVLRSDGNLEFVAIAGDDDARDQLLGRAAPLALDKIIAFGTHIGGWVHVPEERVDEETRAWMAQYGHTPDLPPSDVPDGWRAEDRLVRLLQNEDGDLRATLYLDEPLSGLRPTAEVVDAINAEVEVMYEAVVSIVERELYGEQVRMVTQARTAIQSIRPGLGVDDLLAEMADAMVAVMALDSVDVLLAGAGAPELEPHTASLEADMREVWLRGGHVVLEPALAWGVADDAIPTPEVMRRLMERRGLGSWLLVPIGMGEEYLGTMGLGRTVGGARWIDSEINAAAAVASDLAQVVLDARLMERERTLNAELRAISDYRRDMVNTLAHELRNPVSVLWTHIEMLGQLGMVFGPMRESMAAMDRATRRIEDMIEDLLALAAASDPTRATEPVPVDFSAMVDEVCDFMASTAERAGVELRTTVADGLVVTGEEKGLHRLVTNLLSNAVKYTGPGGSVTVTLAPDTQQGRDVVRLTCSDTGIGIDAAELAHVFTPFFRSASPDARRRPGTGLGLAITERVADRHDGTVEVESVLGAGTTFTVTLPLAGPVGVR